MSFILIITLFSKFFSLSHSEIEISSCENNTRKITLENGTINELPCIICPIGQYTTFSENEDSLNCSVCESGTSNFGQNIIINSFSKKILSRYDYTSFSECQDDNNNKIICPEWKINPLSLKVDYNKDIIKSKSILSIKQYYMNEGELIIKYINYNGGIYKYFNIYINNFLIYKDDSDHSIIKSKTFPINKGENIIKFEYITDNNLSSDTTIYDDISYIEIFEIKMINAETSSLDCNKYDSLEILKDTIHDNCDYYVNKCSNDITCTYRFYSENKSEYCNYLEGIETIIYNKIDEAVCTELIKPSNIEVECEHCTYGQQLFKNTEKESKCIYCNDTCYNSKIINDEETCDEISDIENKFINKIFYITSFDDPSQIINETININLFLGYIEIKYEKFNEKNDTNVFVEINDLNLNISKTIELINPEEENIYQDYYNFNIPIEKGNYSISIKGKNFKLKKISIRGSDKGGNYKCVNKLNINDEIICPEEDEYYSKINDNCTKCPKGSTIDYNKHCFFIEQFINDKYIFDNNKLINSNIFSSSYYLIYQEKEFFLDINPPFPLLYFINKNKVATIIGKELYKVKLVKGINNRGIILSFISNNNNEEYISNIFIKCKINIKEEEKNIIFKGEYKEENIHYYFFTLQSNTSCPYCLVSEVDIINETKCVHKQKTVNVTKKEESLCVIKPYDNSTSSKLINDNSVLLDYNSNDDQILISNFQINENVPINYEKDDDMIITSYTNLNISCKYKRKPISQMGTGIKILLIFAGVLLLFVIGIIIWKIIDIKKNIIPERLNESLTELSENYSSKTNEDLDDNEKENLNTIKN